MNDMTSSNFAERLTYLEQRQRRSSRWLRLLGVVVVLQALVIAYLAVPFGGMLKHPVALQAGRFEVIDGKGNVRAELSAEFGQTLFAMNDKSGRSRVLLRENESGFVTLEFFDRDSNEKSLTLFAGSKRSFLELHDPISRRYLNLQAGEAEMGLSERDPTRKP